MRISTAEDHATLRQTVIYDAKAVRLKKKEEYRRKSRRTTWTKATTRRR